MSESSHPPVNMSKREVKFIDTTPRKRGRPKKQKTRKKQSSLKDESPDIPTNLSIDQPTLPDQRSVQELEEWDPRDLPNGFFMVLEGKRRMGKSTFANGFSNGIRTSSP